MPVFMCCHLPCILCCGMPTTTMGAAPFTYVDDAGAAAALSSTAKEVLRLMAAATCGSFTYLSWHFATDHRAVQAYICELCQNLANCGDPASCAVLAALEPYGRLAPLFAQKT